MQSGFLNSNRSNPTQSSYEAIVRSVERAVKCGIKPGQPTSPHDRSAIPALVTCIKDAEARGIWAPPSNGQETPLNIWLRRQAPGRWYRSDDMVKSQVWDQLWKAAVGEW